MLGRRDRQQLGPASTAQDLGARTTGEDTLVDRHHRVEGTGPEEDKLLLTPFFLSLTLCPYFVSVTPISVAKQLLIIAIL